ncbi:cytochrome c maturation protein CcmE [Caenimonas koreensis]|uniref:cytochrome c maturation protein CcmE n=1 Tax=Caenimonas koreensis TaxID=367474 RepID=UPI003783D215
MKSWKKRGAIVVGGVAVIGIAAALVLNALNSNIALYVTPTDVVAGKSPKGQAFRIGGMVKDGSVRRDNLTVHFVVTDMAHDIPVSYTGILPDLFKEGKGAVVQGRLTPTGDFTASEVLAKHDENYMPPEAKHALDKAQKAKDAAKPVNTESAAKVAP